MDPFSAEPARTSGSSPPTPDERSFADYLDLVLRGGEEDLSSFFSSHPGISAEARRRIEEIDLLLRGGEAAPPTGQTPPPSPDPDLPFARFGEFRLIRRLGQGGAGIVFLAEQESLRRPVALKVLRPERAGDFEARARFEREAQAIARLRHPNIVAVFANGEERDVRYLAMELVPGKGLDETLREAASGGKGVAIPTLLRWAAQIARALACAHEAGIVHRDVKPSNIWLAADGRAMLMDFGLARDVRSATLTVTGEFRGSPYYASPEQVAAKRIGIDARTDVYSLGVTLYEAVAGRVPFEGETTEQIFHQILLREPVSPRRLNPGISKEVETVITTAMEKDPARRYPTAAALAEDLEALLEVRPIRARPAGAATRALKWTRRNPGWAAALAVACLALLATPAVWTERGARARRARVQEAAEAVESARLGLEEYRANRERARVLERSVDPLRFALQRRFLEWEEEERLQDAEAEILALRRGLGADSEKIAAHLSRAERLDPDHPAVRELRSELFLERWREAREARDEASALFYRNLVEENDPEGRHAGELHAQGTLALTTDPPGASVYLFRYREQGQAVNGGEPRLVPVPVGNAAPSVPPGTWCLRVVKGTGDIEENDLIFRVAGFLIEGTVLVAEGRDPIRPLDRLVSIDGRVIQDQLMAEHFGLPDRSRPFVFERDGKAVPPIEGESFEALGVVVLDPDQIVGSGPIPADVYHLGEVRSVLLPAGLEVRTTATPLLASPACLVGATPLGAIPLEEGSYLALLRHPGRRDVRYPFVVERGRETRARVELNGSGDAPEGFVFVPGGPFASGGDPEAPYSLERVVRDVAPFWIMEREVSRAEYLEFLNDPATLEEIASSTEPIRVPRQPWGEIWLRDERGRYSAPGTRKFSSPNRHYSKLSGPDGFPVARATFEDAKAYARWRTRRERERGGDLEFDLPTEEEWEKAARGADERAFPFGMRFSQKWMGSRYSRRVPSYNTSFTYPVDESPYGVFDLGGSLSEYCVGVFESHLTPEDRPFEEVSGAVGQVLRGGGWESADPDSFRTTSRSPLDPTSRIQIGFRLVARRSALTGR